MTQVELARACKVRPPSVNDWESGKTKMIDGWNLLSAAGALEVDPALIMDYHGRGSGFIKEPGASYGRSPILNRLFSAAIAAHECGAASDDYLAGLAGSLEAMASSKRAP